MTFPQLVIGDSHPGIWGGLHNVYSQAGEQRCWNQRILNVQDKTLKRHRAAPWEMLKKYSLRRTVRGAGRAKAGFQRWCREKGFDRVAKVLDEDWERMIAFHRFPQAALEALAQEQCRGIALRRFKAAHQFRQAIQEGGERHRRNLGNATDRRKEISPVGCTGSGADRLGGRTIC